MSIERFQKCLAVTLQYEGGYSDDPDDAGGATNLGIELREWHAWQDAHGISNSSQHDFATMLTPADVEPIYLANYWVKVNDGTLPGPVDMVAFDCAVNEGVGKAQQFLASTEWMVDNPTGRALTIQDDRAAHYHAIAANNPSQQKFLQGWMNRIDDLTSRIQSGVI